VSTVRRNIVQVLACALLGTVPGGRHARASFTPIVYLQT